MGGWCCYASLSFDCVVWLLLGLCWLLFACSGWWFVICSGWFSFRVVSAVLVTVWWFCIV